MFGRGRRQSIFFYNSSKRNIYQPFLTANNIKMPIYHKMFCASILTAGIAAQTLHTIQCKHLQIAIVLHQNFRNAAFISRKIAMGRRLAAPFSLGSCCMEGVNSGQTQCSVFNRCSLLLSHLGHPIIDKSGYKGEKSGGGMRAPLSPSFPQPPQAILPRKKKSNAAQLCE